MQPTNLYYDVYDDRGKPDKFYNPKYSSNNSEDFLEFGTVHWEPNINVNTNGNASFKFPNFNLNSVKIFIEGISANGTLISEVQTLSL